jgi:16S rRNA (guanine966-N2)-methyltransferase
MSVRIVAGELARRLLRAPAGIRPSEARVRAALFSIWADRLAGARFLDLFAGSGAVGLEAVSRGALAATFVEADRRVATLLARNLTLAPAGAVVLRRGRLPDELAALAAVDERFDLVFADPPYAFVAYAELLTGCAAVLAAEGEMALEHSARTPTPEEVEPLVRISQRRYGESALSLYRARRVA